MDALCTLDLVMGALGPMKFLLRLGGTLGHPSMFLHFFLAEVSIYVNINDGCLYPPGSRRSFERSPPWANLEVSAGSEAARFEGARLVRS